MTEFKSITELHMHLYGLVTTEPSTIIEFIKKNGERRTMDSTKMMSEVPLDKHPKKKETEDYKFDSKNMVVFDNEKGQWRSFSVESVLSVNSEPVKITP